MGGVEDFGLLHRPFLCPDVRQLLGLVAHLCFCVVIAVAERGEPFEMCFCLGSGAFSWNNKYLCPDCSGYALIVQLAETEDLKSLCSGFESQWGHGIDTHRRAV